MSCWSAPARAGWCCAGAAEQARERVGRVVFADALALMNGERIADFVKRPSAVSTPLATGPSRADAEGRMFKDLEPAVREWALARYTAHPIAAMDAPVQLDQFWDQTWQATVIRCLRAANPPEAASAPHRGKAARKMVRAGHWALSDAQHAGRADAADRGRAMTDENAAALSGAREAMDGFMAAFNARDAEALRTRWFHFPHVRFHSGKVTVMERPEDYHNLVWNDRGSADGWARSEWDYVEPIDVGPEKVHFRVAVQPVSRRRQQDRQLPLALYRDADRGTLGDPGAIELGRVSGSLNT